MDATDYMFLGHHIATAVYTALVTDTGWFRYSNTDAETLSVASDPEDRSWLRGRLEAHPTSPYVQAARGGPTAGIESLEEELQERLRELAAR